MKRWTTAAMAFAMLGSPLVATLLLGFSGGASWVLALYLTVMAAISLVSICLLSETRQVDLSDPSPVSAVPAALPS